VGKFFDEVEKFTHPTKARLCPCAQMDETVYSAEECHIGFFAWSHESTDMLKNPRKAYGEIEGQQPSLISPAENGIYHVNMTSWGLPSATHAHEAHAYFPLGRSPRPPFVLFFCGYAAKKGSTTKHRGRHFLVGLRGDAVPLRSPGSTALRILHDILWCYAAKKEHKKNVFGGLQPPIPRFAKRQTA